MTGVQTCALPIYDEKLGLVNEFKKTKNNHGEVHQNYQIISPFTFNFLGNIDAVVCESYLGQPMSTIPKTVKLKNEQQVFFSARTLSVLLLLPSTLLEAKFVLPFSE